MVKRLLYERRYPFITSLVRTMAWQLAKPVI